MRLDEIPRPVPEAGEVLVVVKAAGVGPWDRLVREGQSGLGQALPLTLGSDISGTVAALGVGVGVFALGDAVYGATNDQFVGGYAEYALVEANKVAPKPAALDYVTAAGLPVVAVTAWQMLFEYARIERGRRSWCAVRRAASAPARRRWRRKPAPASTEPRAPGTSNGSGAGCRADRGRRSRWRAIGLPAPRCCYRHHRR
jgi:NADPH:quinone reductase and related Zn-dependent oxidoreductases